MADEGIEQRVLDDFKPGDWVGVHYARNIDGKIMDPPYNFPTIIDSISNRNLNPDEDYVQVKLVLPGCPLKLERRYLSRIWHTTEAKSFNGH